MKEEKNILQCPICGRYYDDNDFDDWCCDPTDAYEDCNEE